MNIEKQIKENGYKQTFLKTISQIDEVKMEYDAVRSLMKLLDEKEENILRRIEEIFSYMQMNDNEIYESIRSGESNVLTLKITDGDFIYSIKQNRCYSCENIRNRINISSEKLIKLQ